MRKLCLTHKRAPGDVLAMTSLVRDIALAHPNKFQVSVSTPFPELWENNPYVTEMTDNTDIDTLSMNYGPALNNVRNSRNHFLLGFHEDFKRQTGIDVPLLYPKPDYHLSNEERTTKLVNGRYWIVVAGGKTDFTTKHWVYKRWQQVVNILRTYGIRFVQIGVTRKYSNLEHIHPRLENTLCLLNQTNIRQLGQLIHHADGVLCPVTLTMHMAAALDRPCVVTAGGREDWWWAGYLRGRGNFGTQLEADVQVPHKYLHTIGKLECCKRRACWTNKVDEDCKQPVDIGGQQVPECMDLLKVEQVVEAVLSYYKESYLPPITAPKSVSYRNELPIIETSQISELSVAQ